MKLWLFFVTALQARGKKRSAYRNAGAELEQVQGKGSLVPMNAVDHSNPNLWSRLGKLFERFPAVKRLRLDPAGHEVTVGFEESAAATSTTELQSALQNELNGEWDVSVEFKNASPVLHLHRDGRNVIELHRTHPPNEPQIVWKKIQLPKWKNRPCPPVVSRDHRVMLWLAAICGAATLAGFLLHRAEVAPVVTGILFLVAYVTGGWFAAHDVWLRLKARTIDIQFLMIAVAIGAVLVHAATEGATLLFLFSLSNGLEQFANHRTRKSIESLLKVAPKLAVRRQQGRWTEIPVGEIMPGDELLVKPGELFPVDAVVIEGATSADESALTGEALPVVKQTGALVSGGTLNLDGQCVIRASRAVEDSALKRIVNLIEGAQQQKAPAQRFTDSFTRYYTWFALSLAAAVFVILLSSGRLATDALYRTMTVLVVASPCALVLSIPSAILVAIAAGARNGILFRGGIAVENLARATDFVFDKTGTLTKGSLVVAAVRVFGKKDEAEVLRAAASVAQFSTHPLARAIVQEAERRKLELVPTTDFLNVPGLGMEASAEGHRIFVGSRRFLRDRGLRPPQITATNDAEVWIAGEDVFAAIYLRDEVRPGAEKVIKFLIKSGFTATLLTGDRPGPAALVAAKVGIQDVRAELSPQAKLQCIHAWRADGRKVAMVGDGINDAPSLAAADVSIGMGARGADAALEQADVILMHDEIENLEEAVRLSRRARSIIAQNITVSIGVVALLLVSALLEKINLTLGVIGHEGSTVVVILNALRLLQSRRA